MTTVGWNHGHKLTALAAFLLAGTGLGPAAVATAAAIRANPLSSPTVLQVQAINPERDCQTLRTCRFGKGGSFRGCVSSYSCRTCRTVPAACTFTTANGKCQKLVCDWGG